MGTQPLPLKGEQTLLCGPCLLWPNGRPSQRLLNTCYSRKLGSHKLLTNTAQNLGDRGAEIRVTEGVNGVRNGESVPFMPTMV